ncbi:uncharacterized mitochondrial protein AtMg00310-like [Humulus lupulus]|uniref:uncharacterized mitochondrial protein AtMg00310-like n=1 Tax=Humulus lupulus TaxID=3486 RepID=UPI002B4091D1|nr:uncharacterized mitochondrial protein AtMg00310-like [Humulus lupulus]
MHWGSWKSLRRPKEEGGLGFKDLELFNKALLGKQVWRLYRNLTSLVGKVLKSSYFPNSNVMEAKTGSNASFVWGKEVVELGSKWRIGSGNAINVLEDRWILRPYKFKSFYKPFIPRGLKVIDLIG